MRLAYADPPYPGCAKLYRDHPDYAGEVDHAQLIERLQSYDGWLLHTASTTLRQVLPLVPDGVRLNRFYMWLDEARAFQRSLPRQQSTDREGA